MKQTTQQQNRGFTLLITLLLITVLISVSGSLLNIMVRQNRLSIYSHSSEAAFQAANAGMECALFHDYEQYPASKFDVPGNNTTVSEENSIECMGVFSNEIDTDTTAGSGEAQKYLYTWGSVCTEIGIYKYYELPSFDGNSDGPIMLNGKECAEDHVCTIVESRGYNVSCDKRYNTNRVVERELVREY